MVEFFQTKKLHATVDIEGLLISFNMVLGRKLRLRHLLSSVQLIFNLDNYNTDSCLGQALFSKNYKDVESTLTPGPNVVVTVRFLIY